MDSPQKKEEPSHKERTEYGQREKMVNANYLKIVIFIVILIFSFPPARGGASENPPGKIIVDEKDKCLILPAGIAKQGIYDVLKGAIEYILVSKGGKDYETLFVTDIPPAKIHQAFQKLGLEAGQPAREDSPPSGLPVRIFVEYEKAGKKIRQPVEEFVLYKKTGKPLAAGLWTYTGSSLSFDPETQKQVLQCMLTKSIVGLHYTDTSPLLQNPRPEAKTENIYSSNLKKLPPPGSPVRLVFQREMPKMPKDWKRIHAFLGGRVQGVGFRAFTQREARKLQLTGFVKNLSDGRVEAVVEGPEDKVNNLLEKMKRGPRAARVETFEIKDETPLGNYRDFKVAF